MDGIWEEIPVIIRWVTIIAPVGTGMARRAACSTKSIGLIVVRIGAEGSTGVRTAVMVLVGLLLFW